MSGYDSRRVLDLRYPKLAKPLNNYRFLLPIILLCRSVPPETVPPGIDHEEGMGDGERLSRPSVLTGGFSPWSVCALVTRVQDSGVWTALVPHS